MLNEEDTKKMLKVWEELKEEQTSDRYWNGAVMAAKTILEIKYP